MLKRTLSHSPLVVGVYIYGAILSEKDCASFVSNVMQSWYFSKPCVIRSGDFFDMQPETFMNLTVWFWFDAYNHYFQFPLLLICKLDAKKMKSCCCSRNSSDRELCRQPIGSRIQNGPGISCVSSALVGESPTLQNLIATRFIKRDDNLAGIVAAA